MTEERSLLRSTSVLQSMLNKLKSNEKVHSSSRQTSKFYSNTNDTDQNEGEDTVVSFEEQENSDTPVRPDNADDTDETFTLESELLKSSPVIVSKLERAKHASYHVTKGMEDSPQSSTSQHDLGEIKEESELKKEAPGASSPSNLSQSNKSVNSHAQEPSNKDIYTSKQSLDTISSKALENPNSKTTRSASDPVQIGRRSNRTLSDPIRHYKGDMDRLTTYLGQANLNQQQTTVVKAESPGTPETTECDGSRVRKDKKKMNIAQILKAKFKEKSRHEKHSSSGSHHGDEDTTLSDFSMEEAESPTWFQQRSQLSPEKENSTAMKLMLQRTCTLRDFKLNLEPINLMDELFTGDEWTKFLPVEERSFQDETADQLQAESTCQSNDFQPNNSVIIQNHEPTPDKDQSQSETDQTSVSERALGEVREVHQSRTPVKPIFAVPKTMITNGALKQKKCELPQYENSIHDDVYDFVEVYMLPKNNPKVKDLPLDLPEIKSLGLLNNSALKSRIILNKKRMHRPPKKKIKEKPETKRTSTFYTSSVDTKMDVPSTKMDVPHTRSYSTSSYSLPHKPVTTSPSSSYKSSVFYALPMPMPSTDSGISPALADEKQKAKDRPEKPRLWKLKK